MPQSIEQAFESISIVTALGMVLLVVLVWPKLKQIWISGVFDDPDDAMRLVEVRAWMAGQGWFDLVAHRLDPSANVFMHWSRVVDVPLAALIEIFGFIMPRESAESLARLIDPLGLMALLLAVMGYLGRLLAGSRAVLPTMVLIVGSGIIFGQFAPGSVHHHAIQILLLSAVVATSLTAFDPSRSKMAAVAGLLIALSLSIGLEDLPYIIVIMAAFPLVWAFGSDVNGSAIGYFARGLTGGLAIAFISTVNPLRYSMGVCDAFSIAHLVAGLGACGVFFALERLSWINRWGSRLSLSLVGGSAVVGLVAAAYPACLGDPLAQIDAFTRDVWLANIQEARPLSKVLGQWPSLFPMLVLPALLGTLASVTAAVLERGVTRSRWLAIVGLLLAGWAATLWQIRAMAALTVMSVLGGAWFVRYCVDRLSSDRLGVHWLAAALSLPFCAIAWALVLPPAANAVQEEKARGTRVCQEPSNFEPFNRLPIGLVFAPVNSGSHLLVHTTHNVLAAPYHRNVRGNRTVMEAFLATPEAAYDIVAGSGADYFTFCSLLPQMRVFGDRAPGGLAAALLKGRVPSWLQSVDASGSQYQIFRIKPDSAALTQPRPVIGN
jgi:hypothetical protein